MVRLPLILTALLVLTACQSGGRMQAEQTLFEQLPGGEFVLHRGIRIPPGRVRVIFQDGAASVGASELQPRCELEVRQILETAQIIPPNSYRIGKVRGLQRYVKLPAEGLLLAAAGTPLRLADDGSSEWYMNVYRMELLNDQQEVTPTLICGGAYGFPFYARYPSLQEMRDALGDYATLTLN
ncbi:MAG TPA: hypothetical protein VET88_12240 [Gammaproteobacteria bacterium]|nr:hypothetical protein [Gammaproteobacteria bacterium]